MTVKEILIEWLKSKGHDGLFNEDAGCGCGFDDFIPCGGDWGLSDCQPGKKKIATKEDIDEWAEYEIGDEIFVPIKSVGKP